jgi:hypothetical protein
MRILRRNHSHIKPETLSEFLDGRLTGAAAAIVERRVLECAECQEELDSLRSTVGILRSIEDPVPRRSFVLDAPPHVRTERGLGHRSPVSLIPQWVYAGAAAMAALVLAVLVSADVIGLLSPGYARVEQTSVESAAVEQSFHGVRELVVTAEKESAATAAGMAPPATIAPGQPDVQPMPTGGPSGLLVGEGGEGAAVTADQPEAAPLASADSTQTPPPQPVPEREIVRESATTLSPTAAPQAAQAKSPAMAAEAMPAPYTPQPAAMAVPEPTPTVVSSRPEAHGGDEITVAKEVKKTRAQSREPVGATAAARQTTVVPKPTWTPVLPAPTNTLSPTPTDPPPTPEHTPTATRPTPVPTQAPAPTPRAELDQTLDHSQEHDTQLQSATSRERPRTNRVWRILEWAAAGLALVFLAVFLVRWKASRSTPGF